MFRFLSRRKFISGVAITGVGLYLGISPVFASRNGLTIPADSEPLLGWSAWEEFRTTVKHPCLTIKAENLRLKVTLSSCGWTQFEKYDIEEAGNKRYGGKLEPWVQDRYMTLIRTNYNLDPSQLPFNFSDVIYAIVPGAFFSVSPLNDSNFNLEGVKTGISIKKNPISILE